MISAYNYFNAEACLNGAPDENINFVLALFGKKKSDVSVADFDKKCAQTKTFLEEIKKHAESGKLLKLKKKVGKYRLCENARALNVAQFLEYADAQIRNDKITMFGIIYGAKTREECEEVCKSISAIDALNVLSFFLQLSRIYRKKMHFYSEQGEKSPTV